MCWRRSLARTSPRRLAGRGRFSSCRMHRQRWHGEAARPRTVLPRSWPTASVVANIKRWPQLDGLAITEANLLRSWAGSGMAADGWGLLATPTSPYLSTFIVLAQSHRMLKIG